MWQCLIVVVLLSSIEYGYNQAIDSLAEGGQSPLQVKVSTGWLEGEILDLVTGDGHYYSFKGIPYAAPPVGKLRFKSPKPPHAWQGVRQAKAHGAECVQNEFTPNVRRSEDCLFLNVYTPNITPEHLMSVMVFFHGGGFLTGSGDDKVYGPDFLVKQNVVLVTVNYRLDALGFLCLDTKEVPGNAGLKDQFAALQWVRKNIAKFGGDLERVTIMGESAGGAAVGYHIFSKPSEGYFHRAILMSGVPLNDWTQSYHPVKRAFVLGKILGKETNDTQELLEFLQHQPAEIIVGNKPFILSSEEYNSNIFKLYHYTPVVEKDFGQQRFLERSIPDMLKAESINFVDIMIGHTDEEALIDTDDLVETYASIYERYPELLVPTKIQLKSSPDTILAAADKIKKFYFGDKPISKKTIKEFSRYITESGFVYDVQRFATQLANTTFVKVFFYVFSCYSPRNFYGSRGQKYGMQGAAHMDDLAYLFDPKELNWKLKNDSKEYKMIENFTKLFVRFANYGETIVDVENEPAPLWLPFEASNRTYLDIGETLTVGHRYKADVIEFWDSIYRESGVEAISNP